MTSVVEKLHFAHFEADNVKTATETSDLEVYLCILYNFILNPNTEYSEHFKYFKLYRQVTAEPKCQTIFLF